VAQGELGSVDLVLVTRSALEKGGKCLSTSDLVDIVSSPDEVREPDDHGRIRVSKELRRGTALLLGVIQQEPQSERAFVVVYYALLDA
jgi:hypothetical protein